MGYIFAVIAGAFMSIQGVMNTRLSEKTGLFLSNAYVQATALILSLVALLFVKKLNFTAFSEVRPLYLLGGAFGIAITITVMLSVKSLSPTIAISTILITQLLCAALIDAFGIMDSEKVFFGWNKYVGLAIMIGGMMLFKINPK